MTNPNLATTAQCVNFFQQAIVRSATYWHEHAAVQEIDVPILDRERETVLNVITRSMDFAPAWPLTRGLIIAFASYMERRGHWEVWRIVLERAISVAQRLGDTDGETTLTALLARLSQRQSRPVDVIRLYRRVIRLAKQTHNRFEEGRACSNLGYAYIDGGHWWRAEVLSSHALEVFEELGSEHGRAHTHNHLGLLFIRQRRWDEAERQLQDAIALWEVMGNENDLMYAYGNLGLLYNEVQNPKSSLVTLKRAISLSERSGETTSAGLWWINIGIAHQQLGEHDVALYSMQQAETILTEVSDPIRLAQVWGNLGRVYTEQADWNHAEDYLERALKTHRSYGNLDGEIRTYFGLIEYEISRQDWPNVSIKLAQLQKLIQKCSNTEQDHWQKEIESQFGEFLRSESPAGTQIGPI